MRLVDLSAVAAVARRASVAAAVVSGCLSTSAAWSQTALPQIEVQRAQRSGGTTASQQPSRAPEPAPAPAPVEEGAFSEVEGYVANRSATATKTDTPIIEIPQSISVVTSDEMRDQGATTVQEALRYVPGVYADAYGPDTRGDGELIRGTTPVTYLDGLRLNNGGYWNQMRPDPYTLSRVEVLRGPGSVLYGDSPSGGLVNAVSKRPQPKDKHELGVQYGSFDRLQFQTDLTGKLTADGQWLYRLIGIYRDSNYQTDFVKNDRQLIMPAITWRPTKDTDWTVIGLYQKDETGSSTAFLPLNGTLFYNPNGQIPINRFTSEPGWDKYQTTTKAITSLFEHAFSNNFKVYNRLRYSHDDGIYRTMYPNNYTDYSGGFMPYFPYTDPSRQSLQRIVYGLQTSRNAITADTGGQLDFATGPLTHKVLFGVDLRNLTERSQTAYNLDLNPFNLYNPVYGQPQIYFPGTSLAFLPDPGLRQTVTGLYLQDQMRLGQWLLTAGIRRDKLESEAEGVPSQEDSATTSRLALMYETSFGLNPYISYSESFNPILGANICATFCKPVEGTQYEAGFKYKVSNTAMFNAAVYQIEEKNRLASGPTPLFSVQDGENRIRGFEVEYVGSVTPDIDIIASYSYIDAVITQGDFIGSNVESVPQNYASLWAKHKLTLFGITGFSIGGGVRYIGESWSTGILPATGQVTTIATPDHTLFDAMFAYEDKNWRFQVTATNLADTIYFSSCLARGDCFYGNRRNVIGTLTYKF
jgi:iron complex outermembrane receptor protein